MVFVASITCAWRRRLHLSPDAGDLLAVDEHVSFDEVADFRVHADDGAAFEEDGLPAMVRCFRQPEAR